MLLLRSLFATILALCWGGFGILSFYFDNYEEETAGGARGQQGQRPNNPRGRSPARMYWELTAPDIQPKIYTVSQQIWHYRL